MYVVRAIAAAAVVATPMGIQFRLMEVRILVDMLILFLELRNIQMFECGCVVCVINQVQSMCTDVHRRLGYLLPAQGINDFVSFSSCSLMQSE